MGSENLLNVFIRVYHGKNKVMRTSEVDQVLCDIWLEIFGKYAGSLILPYTAIENNS
jgi:hypothetical protein